MAERRKVSNLYKFATTTAYECDLVRKSYTDIRQ